MAAAFISASWTLTILLRPNRAWSGKPERRYNQAMNAGMKFAIGAVLIVGSVGYLMASGIKETGQYFLTPSELSQKLATDPSFYDVGMKVGANVVPGSVTRDVATQTIAFRISDGSATYPVIYHGLAPDTFNDSVEVVVEGRLQRDGVIHATDVLAKCGSRYESVPKA
jgi:cytochrome c-type biogenesis protein CcmE